MDLSQQHPRFIARPPPRTFEEVGQQLRDLLLLLDTFQQLVARVVNYNEVTYVSQNDPPTPLDGRLMVWKDADAGVGNPTHYLVYNDGGTVVTFGSEETA